MGPSGTARPTGPTLCSRPSSHRLQDPPAAAVPGIPHSARGPCAIPLPQAAAAPSLSRCSAPRSPEAAPRYPPRRSHAAAAAAAARAGSAARHIPRAAAGSAPRAHWPLPSRPLLAIGRRARQSQAGPSGPGRAAPGRAGGGGGGGGAGPRHGPLRDAVPAPGELLHRVSPRWRRPACPRPRRRQV